MYCCGNQYQTGSTLFFFKGEYVMKEWTVMVYLAGDNNLTEDMVNSLHGLRKAMQKPGASDQIDVVAVYDSGYPTVKITHYRFEYRVKPGELQSYAVNGPAPVPTPTLRNPNDILFIKDFVKWAAKNYPAKKYAMIMSGHSDAILGRTMFRDENPATKLSLRFLARLLRESAAENLKRKKFDIIGFDSCLMGMLEVGCQLTDITDYLVSSQGLAPTAGWAYDEVLKSLVTKKGLLSPKEFAESIVVNQIESSKEFRVSGRFMSLSSVELWNEKAPKIKKAFQIKRRIDGLGRIFNDVLKLPRLTTDKIPQSVVESNVMVIVAILKIIHDSHHISQTSLHDQAVDIIDFVEALEHNCKIKKHELYVILGAPPTSGPARQLWLVINQIIRQCDLLKADLSGLNGYVQVSRSSGPDYQFAKGVSLFFPWTRVAFDLVYNTYSKLRFSSYGRSQWMKFIEKYTELTLRPSQQHVPIVKKTNISSWFNQYVYFNQQTVADETPSTRSGTLKSGTLKSYEDLYYRLFRRFRNFPIDHNKP
jgi:hypothetical protein